MLLFSQISSPIEENPRAMRRLRTACERAKRELSTRTQVVVEVDSLVDGCDLNVTVSRARFEELCATYFQGCLTPVEQVLQDARMDRGYSS